MKDNTLADYYGERWWEQQKANLAKLYRNSGKVLLLGTPEGRSFRSFDDFLRFCKDAEPGTIDVVLDLGFSDRFHKKNLRLFYTMLSRILKSCGMVVSFVLSASSEYCKQHCPVRKWTYIGDDYLRFFDKNELSRLVSAHFRIEDYRLVTGPERSFHEMVSRPGMMKL